MSMACDLCGQEKGEGGRQVHQCLDPPLEILEEILVENRDFSSSYGAPRRNIAIPFGREKLHCVPKKTCDHIFDDKLK